MEQRRWDSLVKGGPALIYKLIGMCESTWLPHCRQPLETLRTRQWLEYMIQRAAGSGNGLDRPQWKETYSDPVVLGT